MKNHLQLVHSSSPNPNPNPFHDHPLLSKLALTFSRLSKLAVASLSRFSAASASHIQTQLLSINLQSPLYHLVHASSRMLDQPPRHLQPQPQPPCLAHSFLDLNWIQPAVEPLTGIHFPALLNNILPHQNQSTLSLEVLVGTGSRTVTIIKIKSLKVYAFGFYVHPYSICQKLGSKYASKSAVELKDHNDFYADLLREDIGMTVRLVVNCKGMKISAVKDAFEKSLRDRLVKTNPETDFKCIATFGSFFTKDISLPAGTIIDFRRTGDGQLITEIGGNRIGAVRSRELCRAFFDMYLGEVPVSKQTKEEIGSNIASIVRRC